MKLDELATAVVYAEAELQAQKSKLVEAHGRKASAVEALADAIHTQNFPDQIAIDLGENIMYCDWDGEFLGTTLIPKL